MLKNLENMQLLQGPYSTFSFFFLTLSLVSFGFTLEEKFPPILVKKVLTRVKGYRLTYTVHLCVVR